MTASEDIFYPGGAIIMVYRPAPAEHESRTFADEFDGGHLALTCQAGTPDQDELSITSDHNGPVTDSVTFTSPVRQVVIAVNPNHQTVEIMGPDVREVLALVAETEFPGQITVGAMQRHGDMKPLYAIPTFGVQNTYARSTGGSPTSSQTTEIAQPPSVPFRVMRRFCR